MALAMLAVREAGVFVAAAAGNDGPTSATINAPADAPWLTTVGNSKLHGRPYASAVMNLSGGVTPPPPDLIGVSMSAGHGPAPIVWLPERFYVSQSGNDLYINYHCRGAGARQHAAREYRRFAYVATAAPAEATSGSCGPRIRSINFRTNNRTNRGIVNVGA